MDYYIKGNNELFANQLSQFATEIPGYKTTLGFTDAEVRAVEEDAAYMLWVVRRDSVLEDYAHSSKAFMHDARHGMGIIALQEPPPLVLSAAPSAVLPGIQGRFAQLARKAKASAAYTETIGKALGIVGAASSTKPGDGVAPDLKVALAAGHAQLSFHLNGFAAVNVYKDSGTGYGSKPYVTQHHSPWKEKEHPASGQTALYKYKAIYMEHDEETGSMSAEVSIAVVGN